MTQTYEWVSDSAEATESLGVAVGAVLRAGDLLRLNGDLGAGKTTFSRGLGRGCGVAEAINSPTYLLCKEYQARVGPLLHLDGYFEQRLSSLLGEGLVERLGGDCLVVVEWPERVAAWLPEEGLDLSFARVDEAQEESPRRIRFRAVGEVAGKRLEEIRGKLAESGILLEPRAAEAR